MKDQVPLPLLFFIWRLSAELETALLPVNTTSRILTCGPSSTMNVRFTSLGPVGSALMSGDTVANW